MIAAGDQPAEDAAQAQACRRPRCRGGGRAWPSCPRAVAVRRGVPRRLRASRRAWRSACWQVGGSVRPASPALGTAAQSPSDQTCSRARRRAASRRPAPGRARRRGRPSRATIGLAVTPAVHTIVSLRSAGRRRASTPLRVDGGQPRAGDDLDAAPPSVRAAKRARPSGVWPRIRGAAVDQHPARAATSPAAGGGAAPPRRALAAPRSASTPAKPAPAMTKVSRARPRLGGGVGQLDLAQDVVAQADRVGQVLEAERVLAQSRTGGMRVTEPSATTRSRRRSRSGRPRTRTSTTRRSGSSATAAAEHEVGVGAHRPQRHGDVPRLDVAGRRLGQQRGVEHEVGRVDDRGAARARAGGRRRRRRSRRRARARRALRRGGLRRRRVAVGRSRSFPWRPRYGRPARSNRATP